MFSNQADTDPLELADVTKQRNLNDQGKELAKAFGKAIRAAGVPVGKVYTSQFNRAYETAVLAGFKNIETTVDLSEGGLVVAPDENNRRAKALRDCPSSHALRQS
jgi:phosphohistidine phosphatase SixA